MGKILENGNSKSSFISNEQDNQQHDKMELPIPLSEREKVLERFKGYNIAIHGGNIVALDKSLANMLNTLKTLIPKGERCEIEYIDVGASIYGINI